MSGGYRRIFGGPEDDLETVFDGEVKSNLNDG